MIFEDRNARRWRRVRCIAAASAVLALIVVADVMLGIWSTPDLPALPAVAAGPAGAIIEPLTGPATRRASTPLGAARTPQPLRRGAFLHSAFIDQYDPQSLASLRAHVSRLQVVFPDWFRFANSSGRIDGRIDAALARQLEAAGVTVLARITNTDARGKWFEDQLGRLFRDRDATDNFIDQLVAGLRKARAAGVNFDIETLHVEDARAFVDWLDTVSGALHKRGFLVSVDVPLNDEAYDYEAIGGIADYVVLMAYDQHYATSPPGPIAARGWFEDGIDAAVQRIPRDKLIVGIGAYGYDWTEGQRAANSLGYDEAIALAERFHADIATDLHAVNSRFRYRDRRGRLHQVWLLDAISAWNQYLKARQSKVRGVALWRTGLEDPALWSFYGGTTLRRRAIERAPPARSVTVYGQGELLRVRCGGQGGSRELSFDGQFIDWAGYTKLPRAFRVERFGHRGGKQIALTFDDGPDPRWTPAILSLLAKYRLRAAFFVVGDQGQRFPELVKAEFDAGHVIGNHTFFHPDPRFISPERLDWELNATQRLIEAATGHQTLLFRSPYDTDPEPTAEATLRSLAEAGRLGYIVTAAEVDSQDYERPGVDRIVQNVLKGLRETGGNVIVFHDAGGDRRQTVAAVDRLVPLLRQQGYEIVGIARLAGIPRAVLMPPISRSEQAIVVGTDVVVWLRGSGLAILVVLFGITTIFSIARILTLGVLVARRQNRAQPLPPAAFIPDIRVLIPAYNEARVIARTLDALLRSDYRKMAVSVIDDGSTDETAALVERIAARDPRVRLISQANLGKAAALNRGFQEAVEEFVVTIDADTIVLPHTLRKLIEPFADPSIDAVCGNVQVGNVRNILTSFQCVEYVTSQNYDRRAFDRLNCISVVPGATGAWRRRAVLEAGGYSPHTLTEDTDLTLSVLARGGRITYAPHAPSVTEAPETVATLFRQRFRWSFGALQCLWKHRRQFGRGSLGWVALPNMFLFQVLFPMLAPFGDLILLLCLLSGDVPPVAVGYAMFLAMDLVGSGVAFRLDRRELRGIWVVFVQRFFYRQFMYVVTIAAVIAALRGRRHFWQKLERTGAIPLAGWGGKIEPIAARANVRPAANLRPAAE